MNKISEDQLATVRLERIKVSMTKFLSKNQLMDSKFEILADYIIDGFRAELSGYLLGESAEVKHVTYPADWIGAFKQRWFPMWALKRWPIRWRTVMLEAKAVYTRFLPSIPSEHYRIEIYKTTHDDKED